MSAKIDILVTDTSPLITLAYGLHLDVLRAPGIRIIIPDAVMFEATRFEYRFSGAAIRDFTLRNNDLVTTQITECGLEQTERYHQGRNIKGYGERSALELLESYSEIHPERKMLLLYEDKDVRKRNFIIPENASAITTGDFLRTLEKKNLISSANEIFSQAKAHGQNVERNLRETSQRSSVQALEDHIDQTRR